MKTILHTVDVNSSPEKVHEALATERGLANWWSRHVRADIRVGGLVEFKFIPVFNPVMQITALEKPRLVAWKCVGGHEPWTDNTFQFTLGTRDAGTILFFRHEYAVELSDEEYGRYNFNWGYYLNSLKKLCETASGTPFDPEAPKNRER